ncbi:MAG: energy-coupling factor transporter transmembrane component T [Thermosphaera sp.]
MRKPSVSTAFTYSLVLTSLALILKDPTKLAIIGLVNLVSSMILGWRKVWWLYVLIGIASLGIFINALFFANTGGIVYEIGFLAVREGAIEGFTTVTLRVLLIAGAGAFFVALFEPVEIVKGLSKELRLPVSISLSLSYALRMLPLLKRDLDEIMFSRLQRGYRRRPLTPMELSSTLTSLLISGFEKALWSGISLELRGFRFYRPRHGVNLSKYDGLIIGMLVIQILYVLLTP